MSPQFEVPDFDLGSTGQEQGFVGEQIFQVQKVLKMTGGTTMSGMSASDPISLEELLGGGSLDPQPADIVVSKVHNGPGETRILIASREPGRFNFVPEMECGLEAQFTITDQICEIRCPCVVEVDEPENKMFPKKTRPQVRLKVVPCRSGASHVHLEISVPKGTIVQEGPGVITMQTGTFGSMRDNVLGFLVGAYGALFPQPVAEEEVRASADSDGEATERGASRHKRTKARRKTQKATARRSRSEPEMVPGDSAGMETAPATATDSPDAQEAELVGITVPAGDSISSDSDDEVEG